MKRSSSASTIVDAWTAQQCAATVESLRTRLAYIRDLRVSPELVGLVRADGGTLLRELAAIERNGDSIEVRPHDPDRKQTDIACKSLQREGLKAHVCRPGLVIVSAAFGQDNAVIAIINRAGELARIAVRNHRQAARKRAGADDDSIQRAVDAAMVDITQILAAKLKR